MDELEETRNLLRAVLELHKQEVELHKHETEEHNKSMESFRNYFGELLKHHREERRYHEEEMLKIHQLLQASEERISKTNEMIRSLSETVNQISRTDADLRDSYVERFREASESTKTLLEERSRILRENEAYHNAIKMEREKNDKMMESLIQNLCGKSGGLVNIHQK